MKFPIFAGPEWPASAQGFRRVAFWFVLSACLAPAVVHAQLVTWDVAGKNSATNNPLAATTLNAHFSSASLTLGSGNGGVAANGTFGGTFGQNSLASAITANQYLSFTLTPNGGENFNVSSLAVTFGSNRSDLSLHVALLSSATGFTDGSQIWTYDFANNPTPASQTADLSSVVALLNLSAATEFRFYSYSTTGSYQLRIRDGGATTADLAVFGTTGGGGAIPEPATSAVIAAAATLGVALWRRRPAGGRARS